MRPVWCVSSLRPSGSSASSIRWYSIPSLLSMASVAWHQLQPVAAWMVTRESALTSMLLRCTVSSSRWSGGDVYGVDARELDVGIGKAVEVVGQRAERDVGDDLGELAVAIAGRADPVEVLVGNLAALLEHRPREAQPGRDALVVGLESPGGGDLVRVEPDDVLGDERMRRQAVGARVVLGGAERNPLAHRAVELAAVERAADVEVDAQRRRRVSQRLDH